MTHSSIDQAPLSNPDDDNQGNNRPGDHPESIARGSQDFFGQGTPANHYTGPHPMDRDPDEKHKTKRAVAIAAGSLVLATGAVFGFKAAVNDTAEKIAADRPTAAAPAFPGEGYLAGDLDFDGVVTSAEYDQMDPKEYAKEVPERSRVDDVAEKLHQFMPGAWTNLQERLNSEEKTVMNMPDSISESYLSGSRAGWTDQEYLNYYTIALALLSNQGSEQDKIKEGQRALSVIMSPKDKDFTDTLKSMETANGLRAVYRAEDSIFTGIELKPGTKISDHEVTGEGGRLVLATPISLKDPDGKGPTYFLFLNRSDSDGRIVTMLANSYEVTSPHLAGVLQGQAR